MTKAKIGVFGLWRGLEYVRQFHKREDTEVWAICDKEESDCRMPSKSAALM